MGKTPIAQLKSWFKAGMIPRESYFHDLIDSFFHKDDIIPIGAIDGLSVALNSKAPVSSVDALNLLVNTLSQHLAITDNSIASIVSPFVEVNMYFLNNMERYSAYVNTFYLINYNGDLCLVVVSKPGNSPTTLWQSIISPNGVIRRAGYKDHWNEWKKLDAAADLSNVLKSDLLAKLGQLSQENVDFVSMPGNNVNIGCNNNIASGLSSYYILGNNNTVTAENSHVQGSANTVSHENCTIIGDGFTTVTPFATYKSDNVGQICNVQGSRGGQYGFDLLTYSGSTLPTQTMIQGSGSYTISGVNHYIAFSYTIITQGNGSGFRWIIVDGVSQDPATYNTFSFAFNGTALRCNNSLSVLGFDLFNITMRL